MRKVTIVVPVFMTSCQVSLKLKIGPVVAHATITNTANTKVDGWPVALAVHLAKRVNPDVDFVGFIGIHLSTVADFLHIDSDS